MRCERIRFYGERYREGDISITMRAAIDSHLATCEKCRKEYDGITATRVLFTEDVLPAIPEGILDAILESVTVKSNRPNSRFENKSYIPNWWMMAAPRMRVVYLFMIAVLLAGGIYMGTDLWKDNLRMDVTDVSDNDYLGITAFIAMQPGSVEQTYFDLTSNGAERGGR